MPDLEQQLRDAIDSGGMSRYELGKLSGVSQSSLSRFIRGEATLRLDVAAAITTTLGLELRPVAGDRRSGIVRKRERRAAKPKRK